MRIKDGYVYITSGVKSFLHDCPFLKTFRWCWYTFTNFSYYVLSNGQTKIHYIAFLWLASNNNLIIFTIFSVNHLPRRQTCNPLSSLLLHLHKNVWKVSSFDCAIRNVSSLIKYVVKMTIIARVEKTQWTLSVIVLKSCDSQEKE